MRLIPSVYPGVVDRFDRGYWLTPPFDLFGAEVGDAPVVTAGQAHHYVQSPAGDAAPYLSAAAGEAHAYVRAADGQVRT